MDCSAGTPQGVMAMMVAVGTSTGEAGLDVSSALAQALGVDGDAFDLPTSKYSGGR